MNDLVFVGNSGELLTDSMVIAQSTENHHKSVLDLVKRYPEDFSIFGGVAFETRSFETPGGMQTREVAMLNEQHATLLLTYMRNGDVVRAFKVRLVKAFYDKKTSGPQFNVPTTLAGALRLAAEQAELIEHQAAQLEAAQPAMQMVARYVEARSSKCISDVAKILNWKPLAFIAELAKDGVIFKRDDSWVPYQAHIDVGRFAVKTGEKHGRVWTQTRVEPAGIEWLARKYGKEAA